MNRTITATPASAGGEALSRIFHKVAAAVSWPFLALTGLFGFHGGKSEPEAPVARPLKHEARKDLKKPGHLKLSFSQAADYNRITDIFKPEIKSKIDPQNFVAKREDIILRTAITNSGGGFLEDDKGEVVTLAVAYQIRKGKAISGQADYTEVGTTISRMGGYNSAQLVVTALALKEWWQRPPKNLIVTEILPNNVPSLKTFSYYLGWRPINDKATKEELHILCNETIQQEDKDKPTEWFHCDDSVITHQARLLLSFMDQDGLVHKKNRHHYKVDFSALDNIGLTRDVIHAMALGTTDREKLKKLAPK